MKKLLGAVAVMLLAGSMCVADEITGPPLTPSRREW
jgi:hypothetical protein